MDTKEGIKALWAIAYMAAYLQSLFPVWVESKTPRTSIEKTDRLKVQAPVEWNVNDFINPLPYYEPLYPDIVVELIEHHIGIEGVSEVFDGRYHVGLGFAYFGPEYDGIVLYWTERWISDQGSFRELWKYVRTR